jgi:hypothetical protein
VISWSLQILRFWTLSITLCLYLKCRPVSLSNHNVSEIGFCLRLQVKPTQFGPINRLEVSSSTTLIFVRETDILNKDKTMDNVQKRSICTNVPSSQTFRPYLHDYSLIIHKTCRKRNMQNMTFMKRYLYCIIRTRPEILSRDPKYSRFFFLRGFCTASSDEKRCLQ